jgi:Tfp pilus assembly protein PilX
MKDMIENFRYKGMVLLVTIFVIAMLAAVVIGLLQLSTEETKLVHNQISAAHAAATAEAGLNDAFSELRADPNWSSGFDNKAFNGGQYTVTVSGYLPNLNIESTGTSPQGFAARIKADVTVSSSSPYIIRIDTLRINE